MDEIVQKLALLSSKEKGGISPIRAKQYIFNPIPSISVPLLSYNIQEWAFKQDDYLPIYARSLFIRRDTSKIIVRGYDKFFNIGEVKATKWDFLESNTKGPYELTLKENGCIIYISSIQGHVLVTSKHAFGPRDDPSGKPTHSEKGEEWLDRHLAGVSTRKELAEYLEENDVTAVFELADDEFEEHVLEYPPDKSGLYCHGLNYNTPEFKSMPTAKVHEFAARFGFPSVKLIIKETAREVREFGEECAKTGCYEGNPIEGFVVRCHRTDTTPSQTHFFKIKFDEPYLMFREWREVTRSVISGRAVRKGKFGLTAKYVIWAQAKYRQRPHLFRGFNEGKGIIALRNMFLQEVEGLSQFIGAEVIELCRIPPIMEDGEADKGKEKTLLVPIATVGSGKTTLARCLTILYPDLIGYVQNDNIQAKKPSLIFEQQIMETFLTHDIVFADRNNHLFQHRDGLSNAFKAEYPAGKIIALDWNIGALDKKFVMDLTCARIEERGENHQSLTPQRTKAYRTVIGSFVMKRDEVDLENVADSSINQVVTLDIQAPVLENLETVLENLGLASRTREELDVVLGQAVGMKEEKVKVVKSGGKKKNKPAAFYGIKMKPGFYEVLMQELERAGRKDVADLVAAAKGANRDFHMTIVYRGAHDHPLLLKYDEMFKKDDFAGGDVEVEVERIVLNDRVVALLVSGTKPWQVQSINQNRHITLALLKEQAKAMESNRLIQDYLSLDQQDRARLDLKQDLQPDPQSKARISSFPLSFTFAGTLTSYQ